MIIFDLDDTLVDTSGCITYYKLESALEAMVAEGLVLPDFVEGLEMLRRINDMSISAKTAIMEFLEILGADPRLLAYGERAVYESDLSDLPLFPLEGAVDVLGSLKHHHRLALVTAGYPLIQMQKLKKAGIDSSLFSKILITQDGNKKPLYQAVMEDLGFSSKEVVVCGDRVARDLAPAKELGCKTVLMKWGRGLVAVLPSREVDHGISSLHELKNILHQWTVFSSF